MAHHGKNAEAGGEARVENLEELVTAAREVFTDESSELPPLVEFLSFAVLESGAGQAENYQDAVQLMTLHSAKGLEFSLLFLCGLEDGLFPAPTFAQRSGRARGGAAALLRRHHARARGALPHARRAAPAARRAAVLDPVAVPARDPGGAHRGGPAGDGRVAADLPPRGQPPQVGGVRLGQRVRHGRFGEGIVLNSEGSGAHARVQVNFEREGTKWLVVAYANLELM